MAGRLEVRYLNGRNAALGAVAAAAVWVGLAESQAGRRLEASVARPLEAAVRTKMGRDPEIAPDLKVFVLDDDAIARNGAQAPSLAQWGAVLKALAAQKPRVILVDKLFDLPEAGADAAAFVAAVQGGGAPVFAGAFATTKAIAGRTPLPMLGDLPRSTSEPLQQAYGPRPDLLPAFAGVGHLNYDEGGFVREVVPTSSGFLPHLFLAAARTMRVLSPRAVVPVDLPAAPALYARTFGMKGVFDALEASRPISVVAEGDTVLVIPAFYTGHGDWVSTPRGMLPGGLVVMSLVNGALRDSWLTLPSDLVRGVFVAIFAVAGAAVGLFTWGILFWAGLAGGALLLVVGGLASFAFAGLLAPWLMGLIAYAGTALPLVVARTWNAERERVRLEMEVETARTVQELFFPDDVIETPQIAVAAKTRSASECSGDWWGHLRLSRDRDLVVVCDAIGHGLPAALLTATTHASFAILSQMVAADPDERVCASPGAVLDFLNAAFCRSLPGSGWTSAFVLIVEPGAGEDGGARLRYANAGHPPPILTRREGVPRELIARGNPLGMAETSRYDDQEITAFPTERVLLYTDGLIERQNRKGKELGKRAVSRHLAKSPAQASLPELLDGILRLNDQHAAGLEPDDDVTVVAVELKPASSTSTTPRTSHG